MLASEHLHFLPSCHWRCLQPFKHLQSLNLLIFSHLDLPPVNISKRTGRQRLLNGWRVWLRSWMRLYKSLNWCTNAALPRSVYPRRRGTQGSSKTCAVSLLASDPRHNVSLAFAAGLADETLLWSASPLSSLLFNLRRHCGHSEGHRRQCHNTAIVRCRREGQRSADKKSVPERTAALFSRIKSARRCSQSTLNNGGHVQRGATPADVLRFSLRELQFEACSLLLLFTSPHTPLLSDTPQLSICIRSTDCLCDRWGRSHSVRRPRKRLFSWRFSVFFGLLNSFTICNHMADFCFPSLLFFTKKVTHGGENCIKACFFFTLRLLSTLKVFQCSSLWEALSFQRAKITVFLLHCRRLPAFWSSTSCSTTGLIESRSYKGPVRRKSQTPILALSELFISTL